MTDHQLTITTTDEYGICGQCSCQRWASRSPDRQTLTQSHSVHRRGQQ